MFLSKIPDPPSQGQPSYLSCQWAACGPSGVNFVINPQRQLQRTSTLWHYLLLNVKRRTQCLWQVLTL